MNREQLAEIIHEVLRLKVPHYPGMLRENTPLGSGGLNIDSIGHLELVLMLEARTSIFLRTDNLTSDALETVGSLTDFMFESSVGKLSRG